MSGIYIHIPFCASRCIYCDFFSTTLKGKAHEYADSVIEEYKVRSGFLPKGEPLRTIYLGGGTPSQLPSQELRRLIDYLADYNTVEEITIEANPEDVCDEWIKHLQDIPHLRISMGVQSLNDNELRMLNRRHNSKKPKEAVCLLRNNGVKNISLDLMYGLPGQTIESWAKSIDGIISLSPEHISAYCLSIEEDTRMEQLVDKGILTPADDELCLQMAEVLRNKLKAAGYSQYEISNYSRPGYESKHNSSYWDGTPYLGLGPGAHSYDGDRLRCWNEPNIYAYLNGQRKEGCETLSETDIFNERIMLGLRTSKGVSIEYLQNKTLISIINSLSTRGLVTIKNNHLVLTEAGLALADEVIRELMIE